MMNDKEFLIWIHERLVHTHSENKQLDYMHKLRDIIAATNPCVRSPQIIYNSIEELSVDKPL
jgi:hypothetical protein